MQHERRRLSFEGERIADRTLAMETITGPGRGPQLDTKDLQGMYSHTQAHSPTQNTSARTIHNLFAFAGAGSKPSQADNAAFSQSSSNRYNALLVCPV
jgi:hypothetical protein